MTVALREEEYRALQIYDRIPAGHVGVMVTGFNFEPHLNLSEIAIVDTDDKVPQSGELFVITLSEGTPHQRLAIVQLVRERETARGGVGLYFGFGLADTGQVVLGRRYRYVDGPASPAYWQGKCVGRIVGVMRPRWEGGP